MNFFFDCLVQAFAELADCIGNCAHLIEYLLSNHINDLNHGLKKHIILILEGLLFLKFDCFLLHCRLCPTSRRRAFIGSHDGSKLSRIVISGIEGWWSSGVLIIFISHLLVFLVDLEQVVPCKVVEIYLLHFLLKQVVNASHRFRLLCQVVEPDMQQFIILNVLDASSLGNFWLNNFLLNFDNTPIGHRSSVLSKQIVYNQVHKRMHILLIL